VTIGPESEYVAFSYFPKSGRICLQNADLTNPRTVHLHQGGASEKITLQPGQFILQKSKI
jgi:hypothetical protein